MLQRLVNLLMGCRHENMSWPITLSGRTYRTCLECGYQRRWDPWRWEWRKDRDRTITQGGNRHARVQDV